MVSKKLFSAVVATAVILSIVGASSIAFAQTQTSTATANATKMATANATKMATANATKMATANATTTATTGTATASATASGGFLGLPGFEAVYGVVGLLAVAYLVMLRRK
jgi:PGF-CTERM protein